MGVHELRACSTLRRRIRLVNRLLPLVVWVLTLLLPRAAFAFVPPPIEGHVTDTAGKLSIADDAELERELAAVEASTGNEIAVLLCGSLEGETIEDVAYATFNTWKLGKAGADNGVLLVIAPNERRVRIETGKGVGGALTDLESSEIIRDQIAPLLKQEQFKEAISAGTGAIARALEGGGVSSQPRQADQGGFLILIAGFIAFFAFFVFILWAKWRFYLSEGGTGGFWASISTSVRSGGGSSSGGGGGSSFSGGGGSSGGGGASGSY